MNQLFDWNEDWKNLINRSSNIRDKKHLVRIWDKKAKSYNSSMSQHIERAKRCIAKMDIKPNYSILDVGAGTGAFAIPLAKIVRHITVVEPSIGMINCLRENAEKEDLHNITYINKSFEDVSLKDDLDEYDVVFASYSLMMEDIQETLYKMNKVAKQKAYIYTFAHGFNNKDILFEKLTGKEFIQGPDYIHIVNILYNMGILANVNIEKKKYLHEILNIDECIEGYMLRYQVKTQECRKIIKKYLIENSEKQFGKTYLLGHSDAATISWDKNE